MNRNTEKIFNRFILGTVITEIALIVYYFTNTI